MLSVGATSCERCQYSDGLGLESQQGQDFSVHSVQTGSGAHLASYEMGTRVFLRG
jgi:hypothetical protein